MNPRVARLRTRDGMTKFVKVLGNFPTHIDVPLGVGAEQVDTAELYAMYNSAYVRRFRAGETWKVAVIDGPMRRVFGDEPEVQDAVTYHESETSRGDVDGPVTVEPYIDAAEARKWLMMSGYPDAVMLMVSACGCFSFVRRTATGRSGAFPREWHYALAPHRSWVAASFADPDRFKQAVYELEETSRRYSYTSVRYHVLLDGRIVTAREAIGERTEALVCAYAESLWQVRW